MALKNDTEIQSHDENTSNGDARGRLLEAIIGDNKDQLSRLLSEVINPDDNEVKGKKDLLVHEAASVGSSECLLFLLNQRVGDVHLTDSSVCQPLHYAAYNGHLSAVNVLLQKNADMNARNKRGETSLLVACLGGHAAIVEALLDHYCQVVEHGGERKLPIRDFADNTLLHFAVIGKDYQIITNILRKMNSLNYTQEQLKELVKAKNSEKHTVLDTAACNSCFDAVKNILKETHVLEGVDLNEMHPHQLSLHSRRSPEPLPQVHLANPSPPAYNRNPSVESATTPTTAGVVPIGDLVRKSVLKRAIPHEMHDVTVRVFRREDFDNANEKSLGVDRRTDTALQMEFCCGLYGWILQKLDAKYRLIGPLVMVKCKRGRSLKVEVTVPYFMSNRTHHGKPASTEIAVFAAGTMMMLEQLALDSDYVIKQNVVVTKVIQTQCIFVVAMAGDLLETEDHHKFFKLPSVVHPTPAIKCLCYVSVCNSEDNSPSVATVKCVIDLPTTRQYYFYQEQPKASFILSHKSIELSYKITKGKGWKYNSPREKKIPAVDILPPQIYNSIYPTSCSFSVQPSGRGHCSSSITCQLQIVSGGHLLEKVILLHNSKLLMHADRADNT